jgi:hypothetical protein
VEYTGGYKEGNTVKKSRVTEEDWDWGESGVLDKPYTERECRVTHVMAAEPDPPRWPRTSSTPRHGDTNNR